MATYRANVYPVREQPSVDRGARGSPDDRSGPSICERCDRRFWSWDLSQCFQCDGCRAAQSAVHRPSRPAERPEDEAWVRAARREEREGHAWRPAMVARGNHEDNRRRAPHRDEEAMNQHTREIRGENR
jgi:hypothetical protein